MKRSIIALLALALILTACGGMATEQTAQQGSSSGGDLGYGEESPVPGQPPVDIGDGETASNRVDLDIAVSDDRKVIRNASLQLAADNTRDTYDEIVRITESIGGFVESAEVSPTGDNEQPGIRVTVRVPAKELTSGLRAFKNASDDVISESQGAQDVTETYIDLEAQLTNLTALEVELRALLEEVRKQPDADPDKLLRVFTEISNTRGQIERIQGQLNYLSDAVDLATAQVSIVPTPKAVPIVEEGWSPAETVRDATRTLVGALQDLGDVVIRFVIAALPMLLLLVGLPGLFAYVVYRTWRSRRSGREGLPSGTALPSE